MEFLWYSLYVGSLYNNDTSNTRSANTVGVVLFCPVSNESSTFVALSIFVLYHIVYQSRIYIFDRFWPSRILYYIHHYPVVQYIFLSRLCYAITLEIFSIVCVLSSLLSSLLHHSNIIFGISSSINHISRGEIDTREREFSTSANETDPGVSLRTRYTVKSCLLRRNSIGPTKSTKFRPNFPLSLSLSRVFFALHLVFTLVSIIDQLNGPMSDGK